ncbi:MAG: hypothetical protein EON93_04360 [Burkholderiales bacterium]|nr:MAG: hypothetical protein EON93_04360 [Burkholderiales bacterium]
MGFEIELLAPPGLSRQDLAVRIAARTGGRPRRFFHPQSEPSKVPGQSVFENLTLGFDVMGADGASLVSLVDDLTLQADLDRRKPPLPGWYRIVADDPRLLRLAVRQCDAEAEGGVVLDALASVFGTEPERHASGMVRVVDDKGAPVAICAPLPGERERPCEIVTAPIVRDHEAILIALLDDAQALGFCVPHEGATHIHFDAGPLCSARALAALVGTLDRHGPALRELVGVNPACVRLGAWPPELMALVSTPSFAAMEWEAARAALQALQLTKYCDFNLLNIAAADLSKHTFEVRILPSTLDAHRIIAFAELFEALLDGCLSPKHFVPETLGELLDQLPIPEASRSFWRDRSAIENMTHLQFA